MEQYNYLKNGWYIPAVENDEQANGVKDSIFKHIKEQLGSNIIETGLQHLKWRHDGRVFQASIGERLNFYEDVGCVWVILNDESKNLYLVITQYHGALGGMPILVGYLDLA